MKFTSGGDDGKVFAITSNDDTTITLDLNGDTLTAASGNTFAVRPTLLNCFLIPLPRQTILYDSTCDCGFYRSNRRHAPHGDLPARHSDGRREFVPELYLTSINLSVPQWRRQSGGTTDQNDVQLWPDTSFIIRNPSTVTSATTYTITGEVDMGNVAIPLATRDGTTVRQDNAVAMTRPVDVTLR